MGSPFSPIPYDVVVHRLAPYLNAQDLGRLMRVNSTFLSYFIRDEPWRHIHNRCCALVPFWREHVFDKLPWVSSRSQKKRAKLGKTQSNRISLPRSGIWYTLRRFVSPCMHAFHMIQLVRRHKRAIFHYTRDGIIQTQGKPKAVMVAAVVAGIVIGLNPHRSNWWRVDGVIDSCEFHGALFSGDGTKLEWMNFAGSAAYERSNCHFLLRHPQTVVAFRPMFWF